MQKQRVLVVPTRTTEVDDLPALPDIQTEVHAIAASSIATVLPEPVDWLDIMRALLDGEEYNIVHFCGHLTEEGLILANEVISIDGLVMMFRGSPEHRKLIIFNTCDSADAARRVASNTPCAVIGTIGEIYDRVAATFAVKFYASLQNAQVENYRDAFNLSIGDKKRFIFLEGATEPTEDEMHIRRGDSAAIAAIQADLRDMKNILTGGIGGYGLVHEQREQRKLYDSLAKQVEDHGEEIRALSGLLKFEAMLRTMYENSQRTMGTNPQANIWILVGVAILTFFAVFAASVYARGGF